MRKDVGVIKSLDSEAVVGFRGSLARGAKGMHKGGVPFDPTSFDVDAFIVSDKLAARYNKADWFRDGGDIPEIKVIQDKIGTGLKESIPGIRDEPFTFRIWTKQEFEQKVGIDEQYIIK